MLNRLYDNERSKSMKKSEMFQKAAVSVLKDGEITYEDSVVIIHELMEKANLEAFREEQAAKKNQTEEAAV